MTGKLFLKTFFCFVLLNSEEGRSQTVDTLVDVGIGITAYECHHYIWQDNPALVINAIAKAYAESIEEKEKTEVYRRALNYAVTSLNEMKTRKNNSNS